MHAWVAFQADNAYSSTVCSHDAHAGCFQASAVKPAARDESASQRRKRQKLEGGGASTMGGESAGAGSSVAPETVRWMSWSSQRRAFQ